MNIVLLGGPGAGKGTLAKQLKDEFGYSILCTGKMYRNEAERGTEFGLRAKAYWDGGNLCPDEMTNDLMLKTITFLSNKLMLFDGYPRNVSQAKYLDSIAKIDLVFDLLVDDDVAVQRLINRKAIENRPDDTKDIIENCLKVYHSNNKPMVDYYNLTPDRYVCIDSNGTILQTFTVAHDTIINHMNR